MLRVRQGLHGEVLSVKSQEPTATCAASAEPTPPTVRYEPTIAEQNQAMRAAIAGIGLLVTWKELWISLGLTLVVGFLLGRWIP